MKFLKWRSVKTPKEVPLLSFLAHFATKTTVEVPEIGNSRTTTEKLHCEDTLRRHTAETHCGDPPQRHTTDTHYEDTLHGLSPSRFIIIYPRSRSSSKPTLQILGDVDQEVAHALEFAYNIQIVDTALVVFDACIYCVYL